MLKRYSSAELLPFDVVELILERLPVKSLLKFRSVSKTWKLIIETQPFQERQLIHRRQLRGPDILFVSFDDPDGLNTDSGGRLVVLGSPIAYTVSFPTRLMSACHGSCDGLVCLYTVHDPSDSVVVVNPSTRWRQSLPLARIQQLFVDNITQGSLGSVFPILGFGKDKLRGTYKPVFLYNSYGLGLDNVTTTCEVFDFSFNRWRYVRPVAPYGINVDHDPVHLDGALYWFTECNETKVLSFDLHTETFQVICDAPFARVHDPHSVSMCVLHNCLCVSTSNWSTQYIWSLDSSGGNIKTWKKMCSIDLTKTLDWSGKHTLLPIAVFENDKLLLRRRGYNQPLLIYDLHTKSYELVFKPIKGVGSVCYFQSLFSALSN